MTVRMGVKGFGRIGRALLRVTVQRPDLDVRVVAVNDPFGDTETMGYLLRHDSVMGPLRAEVKVNGHGFHDNEWGYANRLAELTAFVV